MNKDKEYNKNKIREAVFSANRQHVHADIVCAEMAKYTESGNFTAGLNELSNMCLRLESTSELIANATVILMMLDVVLDRTVANTLAMALFNAGVLHIL